MQRYNGTWQVHSAVHARGLFRLGPRAMPGSHAAHPIVDGWMQPYMQPPSPLKLPGCMEYSGRIPTYVDTYLTQGTYHGRYL